jgi:hypothetical protein
MEEGVSTYVEPIARAKAGLIQQEQVWADLVHGLPQGLPAAGDQGLDVTHTWGRTYWGGALFCLLVDIDIRKATQNQRSIRDALRAINLAGGNITAEWPLARALEAGDKGVGHKVLSALYEKMRAAPYPVNLPALWADLGIIPGGRAVSFDDHTPLASIRAGIIEAHRAGLNTTP